MPGGAEWRGSGKEATSATEGQDRDDALDLYPLPRTAYLPVRAAGVRRVTGLVKGLRYRARKAWWSR